MLVSVPSALDCDAQRHNAVVVWGTVQLDSFASLFPDKRFDLMDCRTVVSLIAVSDPDSYAVNHWLFIGGSSQPPQRFQSRFTPRRL